jgi:signal transduction histidine kinase
MVTFVQKTSTHFQRWLTAGFTTTVAVTAIIAIVATFLLHDVIQNKDIVIYNYGQDLILTERLRYLAEKKISMFRGYFLHRDDVFLVGLQDKQKQFVDTIQQLKRTASPEEQDNLDTLLKMSQKYDTANQELVDKVRRGEEIGHLYEDLDSYIRTDRQQFELELTELAAMESRELEVAKAESIHMAKRNFILIAVITAMALCLSGVLAFVFSRTLYELYQSAVRATRLREEMLGIVAHDLKNPIASIGMISALMQRVLNSGGEMERLMPTLLRLDRVTDQMCRLIDDLLVVDKMESGIFSLNLKSENLKTIASDAVDALQPLAAEKQIQLRLQLETDPGEIVCDRDRLYQVFSNLLGNALKFTPNNGSVDFKIRKREDQVHFEIRDSGTGIAGSQIPRLFERHWQAKETSQKGNGLGLYIAQNIVRAHGGEITVNSELGKGSIFTFSLAVKPTVAS